MTTVILVLLCLAIAGRELYLASDKRLPRAQAEVRELRGQVAELTKRFEALRAEVAEAGGPAGIPIPQPVTEGPLPPEISDRLDSLNDRVGHLDTLYDRVVRLDALHDRVDRLDTLNDRMDRLEREFGAVSAPLAGLDLDRDAQRALARSLDAVERVVGELRQEMLDRLDREEGVVPGLLLSEEGEAEALLSEAYERCAAEYGVRVRVRDPRTVQAANGGYWATVYRLSGRRPEAVAEEVFAYARGLREPRDPSALNALLTELAHLRGGGIVRIGSFTAVRTTNSLICGLLTGEQEAALTEPWELAAQLSVLPDDLRCDLTWLRTED